MKRSSMRDEINFRPEDWDRIERDYSAWWAGELERPLICLTCSEPPNPVPGLNRFLANHADASAEELCARFHPVFRAQRYYGDAFPYWFINFGPGVMAGFVGGAVNPQPDTVWFGPSEPREMRDIRPEFDPESYWWKRIVDVTRTACEFWDGIVAVSHTDLGGNLDLVASLRSTEGLLTDLIDAPEEVERVLWKMSGIWRECYDALTDIISVRCRGTVPWAGSWSPKRTYMLQCDFCYMISPAMFKRFVLPELASTCEFLDHSFYHLDGPGALPHLDMLLGIESLHGVQWVPGAGRPEPAHWPDVLRRIRHAGKLCQIYASPEDTLKIVREVGGRGFQFLVGARMTAAEAASFLKEVEAADTRR